MDLKPPFIRDLPKYGQHRNGCGLASLLMLLNVPEHPEIKQFLSQFWKELTPLFGEVSYTQKEYQWAVVLQYLLLKSVGYTDESGKEKIYEFFNKRLEYAFEDQRIMNKFTQEQNRQTLLNKKRADEAFTYLHYTELFDYVTPHILMYNIHTMKTDMELKVLAELFNYQFDYQESEDYTGAIYFLKKEIKKKFGESTQVKWELLEKLSNDPDKIILYGRYHHWLAVRGIYRKHQLFRGKHDSDEEPEVVDPKAIWNPKQMVVEINDPQTGHTARLNFAHLRETDRFYVFNRRKDANHSIFAEFSAALRNDLVEETRRWQQYLVKSGKGKPIPTEVSKLIEKREHAKAKARFVEMMEDDDELDDLLRRNNWYFLMIIHLAYRPVQKVLCFDSKDIH